MEATLTARSDGVWVVSIGARTIWVQAPSARTNPKANLVLSAPSLMKELKRAGVTEIKLAGPKDESGASLAEWVVLLPKSDPDLEAARQACLQMLPVSGDLEIVQIDGIARALGIASAKKPSPKPDPDEEGDIFEDDDE